MRGKYFWLPALAVLLFSVSCQVGFGQQIPDKPDPPRLVNDFAGMLNRDQADALEQKLVSFNDSTSTQIAIVIVPSLWDTTRQIMRSVLVKNGV